MKTVWVLGAGQLGAMLRQAGNPLGLTVNPVQADQPLNTVDSLQAQDVVTPEIESWPESETTLCLSQHNNFINRDVFPTIADRKTQKELLDRLNIPTADWLPVEQSSTEDDLYQSLGADVLLKRRTGGYDGRGQHWLHQETDNTTASTIPGDFREQSIAEKAIPFDEEMSVIGVRSRSGELNFYPLTLNKHVNGILKASIGALPRLQALQAQAEAMLSRLLNDLDYVGVMAMECFRVGDTLLVNELAPRVHNSGHWTQAASSINQFEAHLRAVADLPLPAINIKGQAVMINLVGLEYNEAWLAVAGAELYWYNKDVRAGRKLGHINFCAPEADSLQQLAQTLPEEDQKVVDWVLDELQKTSKEQVGL